MLKKLITYGLLIILFQGCENGINDEIIQQSEFGYNFQFVDATQDKNFFLLSTLSRSNALKAEFNNNPILNELRQKYLLAFEASKSNCDGNVNCIDQLLKLNQGDVDKALNEIFKLVNSTKFKELISDDLRASKLFIIYENLSDEELIDNALNDAITGINNILNVYGLGTNPRYPEIDKVGYDVHGMEYKQFIKTFLNETEFENDFLFFEPSLAYAMGLLQVNNRNEAGRYELLNKGENEKAYLNIQNVEWSDYEYSVILVLGDSPNSPDDLPNISIGGMVRADYGVQLFEKKKAPLIIFSGGHVRPFQSLFSEAIEMKRYVISEYNIPESKILVDPHARHTTTNFRNASRLIYRYGIPYEKKALVVTSKGHSEYISSQAFLNRCLNELEYIPVQFYDRINVIELEFIPNRNSLQSDSKDPLDP